MMRYPIFNLVDRAAAKTAWHARFENRSPSAVPQEKALEVRNATGDEAEILLYEEIGYWGVTAKAFAAQLKAITAPSIVLRINSPGGDVFDGYAMYNALLAHPATITTKVDGLAASAASYVALAGDTVEMGETSLMMIHCAWGFSIGNADDMRNYASTLDKIDNQIAAVYAKKTGKGADEILALMQAETWLDPTEAKDLGLIDAIGGASDAAGMSDADRNRISAMRRRLAMAEADI